MLDGFYNKALHLFTDHSKWRTELENINFVYLNTNLELLKHHTYYLYTVHLDNLFYAYNLLSKLVEKYQIKMNESYFIRIALAYTWGNNILREPKCNFRYNERYKCGCCNKTSLVLNNKTSVKKFLFDGLIQYSRCGLVEIMEKRMCCYIQEIEQEIDIR